MEWKNSPGLTPYPHALAVMAERVAAIQRGEAEELVWLVEHPPLYTAGTSAKGGDLLIPSPHRGEDGRGATPSAAHLGSPPPHLPPMGGGTEAIPVFETGRGGQYTYHGPGQRVVYIMRDLKRHAGPSGPDLRAYVKQLEAWIIATLAQFDIAAFTREGRIGVWVEEDSGFRIQDSGKKKEKKGGLSVINESERTQFVPLNPESRILNPEKKIAALGVRVQKWVTSHGISINLNPDLSHYAGIVPCGIREFGVTSIRAM
ncbi:MAG: lipoyl protein ligase domain-containing protein, partial [Rickettsiales bacterium]